MDAERKIGARGIVERDIRNFLPNVFLGFMASETTELTRYFLAKEFRQANEP